MTDRDLCARLACRWFGWEWWRDKRRGLCAIMPPEANRMGVAYPMEEHQERCESEPHPEQRFRDWWRCWCDKPLPKYDEDGNAMLSLLDAVKAEGYEYHIQYSDHRGFQCNIYTDKRDIDELYQGTGESMAAAVADAADFEKPKGPKKCPLCGHAAAVDKIPEEK